ncbi:APC family permease [Lentzea tibetensis]|uniref:APC family permease n=1 Tax=Lentzea tibetensis TaxID=2591470 RepID=A0A563ENP6_9PSEU|nr:APC family permease [Lentzea tibetensis]TWP48885.1 APC family permease [Lentzea tibetensis]
MTQTPRAVVLGLTAMLGAGVFAGFAPAAGLAGWWFVPALLLSALAALCSAFSTAEQSHALPDAGGGYGYIRTQLGPWPARLGAAAYLLGRFAMAAAIATTFGRYVVPDHPVAASVGLVAFTALLLAAGFHWTTGLSWGAVFFVLAALAVVVVSCFSIAPPQAVTTSGNPNELVGVAGLMFVAFLGFERITAPLAGEPVHSPRVLRVAIPVTIVGSLAIYLTVGAAVHRQLGTDRLSLSGAPLHDALIAADAYALMPVLQAGAAVAGLSSMYFVLAGTRRTMTAMVEHGDLPTSLSRAPRSVDVLAAAAVLVTVLLMPFTVALGVAACAMLFYYAFTNASARILLQDERTWPMRTACFGLGISVLLAMSVPVPALLTTIVGLGVGTGLFGLIARAAKPSVRTGPTLRAT